MKKTLIKNPSIHTSIKSSVQSMDPFQTYLMYRYTDCNESFNIKKYKSSTSEGQV